MYLSQGRMLKPNVLGVAVVPDVKKMVISSVLDHE
jgi:hypothetical protein